MTEVVLAFLSAMIGAIVALWTSERQLRLFNVTAERAIWRERIRTLTADLVVEEGSARQRAAVGIQLSTNPFDALDREIVLLVGCLAAAEKTTEEDRQRLLLRLQLLLKHDWERAKSEATWSGAFAAWTHERLGRRSKPSRPDYSRFLMWRERHSHELDGRLPPP